MDRLEQYREFREAGKRLNARMLEDAVAPEAIRAAAEQLGIAAGDQPLVYDRPIDMTAHQEYLLHEHRTDGRTAVERFRAGEAWESSVERDVLDAMDRSVTSLFRVSTVEASAGRLVLADLLSDVDDIELTDLGLSQTAEPGSLLFFRRIPFDGVTMTAGTIFPFSGSYADHLQTVYDRVSDRVPSRPASVTRFVSFYKLHRKYGSEVQSLETGPGPDETATQLTDLL